MTEELGAPSEKLVMIVDDDDGTRELMETMIKREGFRVSSARDGQEGFDKIMEEKPDLVLLDLRLPKLQGFEVVRQLQDSALTEKIPIIIVTGHTADPKTGETIRKERNVIDLLIKPLNPMALGMTLHRVLKTRPAGRQNLPGW